MRTTTRVMTSFILVLSGALFWRWSTQEPEPLFLTVRARSYNSPVTRPPATPPSQAPLPGAAAVSPAAGSDRSPAATARREQIARASALETCSGPEPAPGLKPGIVLENMRMVFRQCSSRFGGNPVGTNPEITRFLNGQNPGHVVFLQPEDGLRINEHGELVDNWNTPFFFHQLSRDLMEIHSAGPDRKMWTSDDLVIK
jgi:hypothetical protein